MSRAEYHTEKERNRLFKNTLVDPVNGVRDHAILRLIYGAPVRPLEASRLMTHDLSSDSGKLLYDRIFEMRSEVAFNGKARQIPVANEKLLNALQCWLDYRIDHGWGVTKTGFIDLSTNFFLRNKIEGFKIVTSYSGEVTRHNNDSFNRVVRKRLSDNNITGSIDSALRTWTLDRNREERCIRRIWGYRGDAELATVKNIVDKDPVRLGAMVENVY